MSKELTLADFNEPDDFMHYCKEVYQPVRENRGLLKKLDNALEAIGNNYEPITKERDLLEEQQK